MALYFHEVYCTNAFNMNAKKAINEAIDDAKSTVRDAKDYAEASVTLAKLKAADKASTSITNTVAYILVAVVSLYVLLFAGISLAFALTNWLNSITAGFLIVTGIYALLGVLLFSMRNRLIKLPVLNALLDKFFNKGVKDYEYENNERLKKI